MTSLWQRWRLKSPASRLFAQSFIQVQIKENIKAPRRWPLCGEFTGTGEFSAQRASNAENGSIWWRHLDSNACIIIITTVTCAMSKYMYVGSYLVYLAITFHYVDVIMGAMASQITTLTNVYSTVYSGAEQRKFRVTGLCAGNSPETQMASECFHLMTSSCLMILQSKKLSTDMGHIPVSWMQLNATRSNIQLIWYGYKSFWCEIIYELNSLHSIINWNCIVM